MSHRSQAHPSADAKSKSICSRLLFLAALAALCAFPPAIGAQKVSSCKGPAELEQTLASHPSPGAFDALGAYFAKQHQLACAVSAFKSALALAPTSWEAHYDLAIALLAGGHPRDAVEELRSAARLKPDLMQVHLALGLALEQLNQRDAAMQEFKTVLKAKPKSVPALKGLTDILIAEGRYNAAIDLLKDAPDDETLRLNLASALAHSNLQKQNGQSSDRQVTVVKRNQANEDMKQGNYQIAIISYRESIAKDPNDFQSYYGLALALDKTGDASGERQALQKAVKLGPSYAPAHNQLGLLDLREGQAQDAEAQLKTAISLDPQYAEAQNNLGVLYGQLGNNSAAEPLFRKATENNPQYAQAYVNLGLILAAESRDLEASQVLQRATELSPKNTSALTALAMILVRLNRKSEAIPYFRKVTEFDPTSAGAHLNLGIALADQFDFHGALQEFSEAARLEPGSSAAHYNRGRALLDMNRSGEAKAELEKATLLDPKSAEPFYSLGMLAKQQGDTAESVRQFQKAVELDPKNVDAMYLLGQQLLHEGDSGGAIEQWRKVIEIQPENGEALYSLSRLLKTTNPEQANRLETRLQALQAEQHLTDRAQLMGNLALASANAHDWPGAISQLKEALQICGNCRELPLLHKDLGLIYCHSGDFKNGRVELLAAQKLSPGDADIAKSLRLLSAADH
jgi:tetratricopeptide (TPR) repeat protein